MARSKRRNVAKASAAALGTGGIGAIIHAKVDRKRRKDVANNKKWARESAMMPELMRAPTSNKASKYKRRLRKGFKTFGYITASPIVGVADSIDRGARKRRRNKKKWRKVKAHNKKVRQSYGL